MASPQVENGYIKISTELWQFLTKIRIPGECRQVLDHIIRQTYGFHKKEDLISLSQFVKATGINKQNVVRSINKLVYMNIIIKKDNGVISSYCLQKNYDAWRPLSKKITTVIKKDNPSLSKKIPTKDIYTKDNITKDNITYKVFPKEVKLLYDFFLLTFSEKELSVYKPKTEKQKNEWLDVLYKCHRIDKYPYWKILDIIEYFRDDQFWRNNFYSPMKLRISKNGSPKYIEQFCLKMENSVGFYPPKNEEEYLCQQVDKKQINK